MEALAGFFDKINSWLGVSSPSELMVNPYFIGFLIILLLYAMFAGQRYMAILLAGVIGTGFIIHYLFPADTSNLGDLLTFVAVAGVFLLALIYLGFIRE
jgi:hypothetical protein